MRNHSKIKEKLGCWATITPEEMTYEMADINLYWLTK
jgi:hypothetical protein